MSEIGKLTRVPLRTVWKHEARDFSVWLEENIDVLNEALDLDLDNVEREQSAGSFSVDLVAEDGSNRTVIIENQLEKSDHDHLGKLITYLTAFDAKVAIWIVAEPRPEHVAAVSWLNESTSADFFLFKVEAVAIGDSPPAPLLTKIVGPSEEAREVGKTKTEIAERYTIRRRFWKKMLEQMSQESRLFANIMPSQYSWIATGSGRRWITYQFSIRQQDTRVELYIAGPEPEENNKWFDQLKEHQNEIETAFDRPLQWLRMSDKKASRIVAEMPNGGYRNDEETKWSEIHKHMIDTMLRFEKAMKPFVGKLR